MSMYWDGQQVLGLLGVGDCVCDQGGGDHDDVLWLVMTKGYCRGGDACPCTWYG
jgi:hypothetical protein